MHKRTYAAVEGIDSYTYNDRLTTAEISLR